MNKNYLLAIKQAMLIPGLALYNIFVGLFASGYSVISQHISELALAAPFFSYTHRLADVLIGLSMCIFSLVCLLVAKAKFTFLTMFAFGTTWVFAGVFILTSPLHDVYGLTTVLIVVPVIFALEMQEYYSSKYFKNFCVLVTLIHVVFFWFFNYGFMPIEYKGVTQRVWVAITLAWYGIAAYQVVTVANKEMNKD
ncbi:DUF998 domain-containing protein [Pseudoalteromonas sp. OOF1S-7]|uniref:DUF998 domain-containing protein n=1 Tax=Pseudoalteromonas sp. OOF1S-7 TaxID=2917757 RepID=UPI001EF3DBF4|nr:DUF998 domain-containing protein [Pseudoalteromonas sp. OOF1S-7]MCG7537556.1 DUF998 domain-containing protein [Pseudoalteromonas sp. OOF1S-7]